jgi:uncharacterized protein (TIRG00374 family)
MKRLLKPSSSRTLVWIGLTLLALLALSSLRSAPIDKIWAALSNLSPARLAVLIFLNLLITLLFSSRWWLILRCQGQRLPYLNLAAYRLAGFSISYFTPGTQFGGEPLQLYLLHRRHKVADATALASLTLDKLFELSGNFSFLGIGVLVLVSSSLAAPGDFRTIAWAAILLALPLFYLLALWLGKQPASAILARMPLAWTSRKRLNQISGWVSAAEEQASALLRQKPLLGLAALLISGLTWLLSITEYWLMLNFLGAPVDLSQSISALTSARLAFMTPIPAGLGLLEASQVMALQRFGFSAAIGLSASLLIRGRDLALGLTGLWLGGWLAGGDAGRTEDYHL